MGAEGCNWTVCKSTTPIGKCVAWCKCRCHAIRAAKLRAERTARDAAPTPEGVVLGAEEREALVHRIVTRYYERGIQTNETGLTATAQAAVDVLAAERGAHEGLRRVLNQYFDFDVDPFYDRAAACPQPEDVWRLHRDLKAALAAGVRGE